MKYFLSSLLLALVLLPQIALAQEGTLLPGASSSLQTDEQTYEAMSDEEKENWKAQGVYNGCDYHFFLQGGSMIYQDNAYFKDSSQTFRNEVLACAIKSGKIRLWMIPYFITYFANFFIGIAGTVSLLFVLLGGFWYMTGGLTDDKEKGKKTIFYALIGMVITLVAWIFVNVIQVQVTG